MKRVLNRKATVEGVDYPEGTSLDKLPAGNRDSLIGTGWTRLVPETAEEEATLNPPDPDPTPAPEPGSAPESDDAPTTDQPTAEDAPVPPGPEPDDSPSLDTLEIANELKELLRTASVNSSPLATVNDVRTFGEQNNGFRVIKGIGKVGSQQIQAALKS